MLRLRVLGAVDLRDSEGSELRTMLAQPKRVALLAHLVLATPRDAHRRDKLVALFWPEHDAEHARNALSQALHFLRRALGPDALVSRGIEEVAIATSHVWCDALAFEEALDSGRLNDAVELYRGDLLEAFHIADTSVEFERWLDGERQRLARRFAGAVEQVAGEREAAGDFAGAVLWWRRLAARDPYSSRVTIRLMHALAAAGDPAAAVQHARVHEQLLRTDLEAAPDPEVGELAEQLKSAPPGSRSTPQRSVAGPSSTRSVPPSGSRRRLVATAGVLVLILAGAIAVRSGLIAAGRPWIRSIAVLPPANLSGDSAQQWFVDGMHDLLITELSRYPELSVISRTSALQYRGTTKGLPQIARELDVDAVIEGTVVRAGGRVRVTAQLVDGSTDRHLWAARYERDLGDVLALQAEIAQTIAREVRVVAAPLERRLARTATARDSAPAELYVRELYLRGQHAEVSRSLAGVQSAKEYYRRAIERDSTFALGYAGLAGAYSLMAMYAYAAPVPALDSARVMARRAVALDSTLPETRTAMAITLGDAGDYAAAEREFRRATELGPSDPRAHYWYSALLVALGRGQEALRMAQRSAQLDPYAPRGVMIMQRFARYLIDGSRSFMNDPVGTRWVSVLGVEPGEPWAHRGNAFDLAEVGKCSAAQAEMQRGEQLAPNNTQMLVGVAMVEWWCGDKGRARAMLQRVERRPDARHQGNYIAQAYAVWGERDSAFAWLERSQWMMLSVTNLRGVRWLDAVRTDPRFPALLNRLGLQSASAFR